MAGMTEIYVCPVCDSAYARESEAMDCLRGHEVEEDMGWVCDCGMAFRSETEMKYHSSRCQACKPSCSNCNNFIDGRRHAPCERDAFSEDMSPCDDYRKVKVAP